jgi:hypothetical protein
VFFSRPLVLVAVSGSGDPPRQDILEFEGWLGRPSYEAVPTGRADEVVDRYKRRARKLVTYRVLAVVLLGVAGSAVLFRFVESLRVAGGVGLVLTLAGAGWQLRALNQGVPQVVARDVPAREVRAEYGVDPARSDER